MADWWIFAFKLLFAKCITLHLDSLVSWPHIQASAGKLNKELLVTKKFSTQKLSIKISQILKAKVESIIGTDCQSSRS